MFKYHFLFILGISFKLSCSNAPNVEEAVTSINQVPLNCPSCNLSQKDFSSQDLTNANFLGANLEGANFTHAKLDGAVFSNANLKGVNFSKCSLKSSNLGGSNFNNADLSGATFYQTQFDKTDLQYARLSNTSFLEVDLRTVIFGPHLKYSSNPPSFDQVQLNCEFPWLWNQLNITNSSLPDCSNFQEGSTAINLDEQYLKAGSDNTFSENAIHISSSTGVDSIGCGTASKPCKSIAYGIDQCPEDNCSIFLAYGEYLLDKPVDLINGLSIQGGFVNWKATTYRSSIKAAKGKPQVFLGKKLADTIKLSHLILNGALPNYPNQSAEVLNFSENSFVALEETSVNAAKGFQGYQGLHGTQGSSETQGRKGGPGNYGGQSTAIVLSNAELIALNTVKVVANAGGQGGTGGTGGNGNPGGMGGIGGTGGPSYGYVLSGSALIQGNIAFYFGSSVGGHGGEGGQGINCKDCNGTRGTPGQPGPVKKTLKE